MLTAATNAVAAVALGCSLYAVRYLVVKLALPQRLAAVKTHEADL